MTNPIKKINKKRKLEVSFVNEFKKFVKEYETLLRDIDKYIDIYNGVSTHNKVPKPVSDYADKLKSTILKEKELLLTFNDTINNLKDKSIYTDKDKEQIVSIIRDVKLSEVAILNIHMDWTEFINRLITKKEQDDKDE